MGHYFSVRQKKPSQRTENLLKSGQLRSDVIIELNNLSEIASLPHCVIQGIRYASKVRRLSRVLCSGEKFRESTPPPASKRSATHCSNGVRMWRESGRGSACCGRPARKVPMATAGGDDRRHDQTSHWLVFAGHPGRQPLTTKRDELSEAILTTPFEDHSTIPLVVEKRRTSQHGATEVFL